MSGPKTIGGKMPKTTMMVDSGGGIGVEQGFWQDNCSSQFAVCIYAKRRPPGIGNNPK